MTALFVWLRTQSGNPEPQLWHLPLVGAEHLKGRVLAQHPISEAAAAHSLDELARRYPAPAVSEECE